MTDAWGEYAPEADLGDLVAANDDYFDDGDDDAGAAEASDIPEGADEAPEASDVTEVEDAAAPEANDVAEVVDAEAPAEVSAALDEQLLSMQGQLQALESLGSKIHAGHAQFLQYKPQTSKPQNPSLSLSLCLRCSRPVDRKPSVPKPKTPKPLNSLNSLNSLNP